MNPKEMRAALAEYDAVLPTLEDLFSADVFAGLENPRCKILANFGVGIIGMGRIGQAIARRCQFGFDMKVVYTRRSGEAEYGFAAERVRLEELLARSDFVVLCVPSTLETHHMINTETLDLMAQHAHLINISRGEVVDEVAPINALQKRQIAGAGLDLYEFEPDVPDALRGVENVTLLPHLGTAALEVREDMGMMAVENLTAYFRGETPPNLLN